MTDRASRVTHRRVLVTLAAGLVLGGAGAVAARADVGLTITPSSGAPGSRYTVTVQCGEFPLIYGRNTQDAGVQGTIAPRPSDSVAQVSPSVWAAEETADETDVEFSATCGQAPAGSGRFDAESPHLWLGPRRTIFDDPTQPRTVLEGTDCPAGTTASVDVRYDGDILYPHTAEIDQYGDWSVPLPAPVGSAEMSIRASCGSVTYDPMSLTTTSTSTPPTAPPSAPPGGPGTTATSNPPSPPPAAPQASTAHYTG